LFFLLGALSTIWIKEPSWLTIMLPTIIGLAYALVPNFVPFPFDDALVATAGAIISFALAIRRYADMPKWILVPLLGAALYTLVGEFIPGPVDDLLVGIITTGVVSGKVIKHQLSSENQMQIPDKNEIPQAGEM
jgi:hypothetical protein